jgi:hypothetical protein
MVVTMLMVAAVVVHGAAAVVCVAAAVVCMAVLWPIYIF